MNEVLINRLRSFGNKSIGFILFVICLLAIYNKVLHNENLNQYSADLKIQLTKISLLEWGVLLILFLCNYLVEAIKWKYLLASWHPISMIQSFKSVLVGQSFAFFTPARSGDYVGRILWLPSGSKMKGVAQMAWSSYSQLLITVGIGSVALFFNLPFLPWLKWVAPIITVGALWVYFHPGYFKGWLKKLNTFHIPISFFDLWVALGVLFLALSIIPVISITELVIRGQLIVLLLEPWYNNSLMLICVSTIIWLVNLLLPAIIGAILLLKFRLKQ